MFENPSMSRSKSDPADGDTVAQALAVVRASALKMIRLQLAMERRDRRVALELIDDLVALDHRLEDLLAVPVTSDDQVLFKNQVVADRATLNHEKHALAAEVLRRPGESAIKQQEPSEDDWRSAPEPFVHEGSPRHWRWLFLLLILAMVLATGAYSYGV